MNRSFSRKINILPSLDTGRGTGALRGVGFGATGDGDEPSDDGHATTKFAIGIGGALVGFGLLAYGIKKNDSSFTIPGILVSGAGLGTAYLNKDAA